VDNTAGIWDATTYKLQNVVDNGTVSPLALPIAWRPDSQSFAIGESRILLVDSNTGIVTKSISFSPDANDPDSQISGMAWSPDGSRMAVASQGGYIYLIDANSGQVFYDQFVNHAQGSTRFSVFWSIDGSRLITNQAVLAAQTGQMIRVLNNVGNLIAVNRNATLLASAEDNEGGDPTIALYDLNTGNISTSFPGGAEANTAIDWSPDGSQLAVANRDGMIHLFAPSPSSQPPTNTLFYADKSLVVLQDTCIQTVQPQ
jgi:WD40 repeat protein